jgi:hypothetical protein
MDLSKLSDDDLMALKSGGLSKVSDEGLMLLKGGSIPPVGPRTMGTNISSDVPTVITEQNRGSVAPVEPKRSISDKLKALYEVPATIGSGIISQPVSMAYGLGRSALDATMQGQAPSGEARDMYYRQAREKTQFQPTSPVSISGLESLSGALEAAKLPPYIGTIGAIPSMSNALRNPALNQGIRETGEVAQAVGQNISPVVKNMTTALRGEPKINIEDIAKTAPTMETLSNKADTAFNAAEQAGVLFKPEQFVQKMTDIGAELRSKGYTPNAYPMVTGALKELQNPSIPKDFTELQALREIISGAQSSNIPKERRLASILKSKFDEYVIDAPESAVSVGSKEGAQAWKEGRDTWSKLAKSETFTNMIDKAELNESKKSVDMYLRDKMLALASNDDKMRLFTPEEQKVIRQVAEGSGTQNMLSALGKTSLRNILGTGAGSLIGFALGGPVGAFVAPAVTTGSKYIASKMRKSEIDKLAAFIRAGGKGAENE